MKTILNVFITLILLCLMAAMTGISYGQEGSEIPKQPEDALYLPRGVFNPGLYDSLKHGRWQESIDKLLIIYNPNIIDPKIQNLKYYLAYCHAQLSRAAFRQKRYKETLRLLDKAIEYTNDQYALYLDKGTCYFSMAEYEEAEQAFQHALHLKPGNFKAHQMLGELCYLANNMEDARQHWQKALEVKPDNEAVKKRMASLRSLDKLSGDLETEADMLFAVTFNGTKKPELRELVLKMLGDMAIRVDEQLGLYPRRQIPVTLLTDEEFFDITGSPQWAGGVYEGHIKIPVDKYKIESLRRVLLHEYVHAVIFDRFANQCPWWLNEGLAQYLSGDAEKTKKPELAARYISQFEAPELATLPGSELTEGDENQVAVVYSLALSAVKYFIDTFGMSDMKYVLDLMAEGKSFDRVIQPVTGYSYQEFQQNWGARRPGS